MKQPLVAVLGPTASGKSRLAEYLAKSRGGELINADASAMYRDLYVGVTKPSKKVQARIPYHLLDVSDLNETVNMADYQRLALAAIEDIASRGRLPIVVGGSSLYVRALLEGYSPPNILVSPAIREKVRGISLEESLDELERRDPAFWARIDRKNPRRVTRALELVYANGGAVPAPTASPPQHLEIIRFVLMPDKEALEKRIVLRTESIWQAWREEVISLEQKGLASWLKLRKPIGYLSVAAELQGRLTRQQAIDEVVRDTRLLAKKQRTWLQKGRECLDRHEFQLVGDSNWSEQVYASALDLLDGFLKRLAKR